MSDAGARHVAGLCSILGRPSAGKSTLLNALVGMKVAIVSTKPQTTRTSVQGVWTTPNSQVVFVDTPGIHKAGSQLSRRMMQGVRASLDGRDLLLFMVDARLPFTEEDSHAVDMLRRAEAPVFLLLNKVDQVKEKPILLALIDRYRELAVDFAEFLPISALRGEGMDELRKLILARMPERPPYFPEDEVTDQPERFLAAEFVREQVLHATRQEVPHAAAVAVDSWEELPNVTRVHATIYVEREGQKKIIIGAGGASLKQIGTRARLEIESLLGRKVYLQLLVKVRPGWRDSESFLNELDWRTMAGGRQD